MTNKDLYWQNDTIPASKQFQDIYFSAENGLKESRHVFLDGINAPKIWQDKDHFTLLENGFGSGLNFVLTCHEWLKSAPMNARLTYIATEKYPLAHKDIDRALSQWPQIEREKQELLAYYPACESGFHSRDLFKGRVRLLLLIGDSADYLPQLEARVDGFYLDGFAPRQNQDMWSADIFSQLARLAAPDSRLATFTAAGFVRRGLTTAGFHMEKADGFGRKREMLRGRYNGPVIKDDKPWFGRPASLARGRHVAIIGGGIAGLCAGLTLQNTGYKVTIYEQDKSPMNRASGNMAALLDPYMGKGIDGDFYQTALAHALDFYHKLDPGIFLTPGLTKYTDDGEFHFPQCGAVSPPVIRKNLMDRLTVKSGQATDPVLAGRDADAVIICGGPASNIFTETGHIPLTPVRGQVSFLGAKDNPLPPHPQCGTGYLIPLEDGKTLLAGASFNRDDTDISLRPGDHRENQKNAAILWPPASEMPIIGGRAAIRAMSPDHLPLCGPVPDFAEYHTAYAPLKHGPKHQDFAPAPYQPNLYMVAGLGARGFMTAPLLAALIAALLSGAPLPLPRQICHALHPARFLIRNLIRGQ